MTNLPPHQILAAAKYKACKLMPYFTTAIYMLIPHEQPGLGTLGVTSKAVLFWDPEQVAEWGIDNTAGVLLHEVSHLLRKHHARADRLRLIDPTLSLKAANICQDLEINDDLAQVKAVQLPDPLLPSEFDLPDGKLWEEYYATLKQRAQEQGGGADGQAAAGQHPGQGNCGSCARGGDGEEPNGGRTPDGAGRSEVELQRVQRVVAQKIQEHVDAHGRGSVPGGWQVWAGDIFEPPKVDWREQVLIEIGDGVDRVSGCVDFAFDRPARRQLARGFQPGVPLLPRHIAHSVNVTVIFDTSGSMSGEPVKLGVIEVLGVLDAIGVQARFVAVDSAVHSDCEVECAQDVIDALKGGGGTDFRPAFEYVLREHEANVIVMLTDGYGPMPMTLPDDVHLVGVLCGEHTRIPYGCSDEGGWDGSDVTYGTWITVTADEARTRREAP
jgi:predicted metal-dependent peptidase